MSYPIERLHLSNFSLPFVSISLRAGTFVCQKSNSLVVVDANGARTIGTEWFINRHELTPDGRYLLALGDSGRRARVWDASTGRTLRDFVGDPQRRESLQVGLTTIDGTLFAFVASSLRKTALSIVTVEDGSEHGWLDTAGLTTFYVQRVVPLTSIWIALRGFRHAEQYDTIVALATHDLLCDHEALQAALLDRKGMHVWGGG